MQVSAPGGGGLHSEHAVWGSNENKHKVYVKCHSPIWRSRRGRQGPSQVEASEALVLDTNPKGMLKKIKLKKFNNQRINHTSM